MTATEKVLYSFTGPTDGAGPAAGLIADANGDLFGTTAGGGAYGGDGTVFELVNTGSGYTERSSTASPAAQPMGLLLTPA